MTEFEKKLEKILEKYDIWHSDTIERMKAEIKSLIAENLPKEKEDYVPDDFDEGRVIGYNRCIQDCKERLG